MANDGTQPKKRRWKRPKDPIKLTIRGKDGVVRPAFTIDPETNCWNSNGSDTRNGYRRTSGTTAQRDAYERLYGPLAPGQECHHLCENKRCMNAAQHIVALSSADHAKVHAYLRATRAKAKQDE